MKHVISNLRVFARAGAVNERRVAVFLTLQRSATCPDNRGARPPTFRVEEKEGSGFRARGGIFLL